jgi:hypothetical protein
MVALNLTVCPLLFLCASGGVAWAAWLLLLWTACMVALGLVGTLCCAPWR